MIEVIKTDIEGVVVVEPKIFQDNRGYFFESYNESIFIKDNSSLSKSL